jgi:hypothetical protein
MAVSMQVFGPIERLQELLAFFYTTGFTFGNVYVGHVLVEQQISDRKILH